MAETLGHTTSHAVWTALESTYHHDSLKRTHTLRDSLNHLKKGTSTVAEYARKFKSICDQLTVIGHPLDENDKSHWFLCGLSSSFEISDLFRTSNQVVGCQILQVVSELRFSTTKVLGVEGFFDVKEQQGIDRLNIEKLDGNIVQKHGGSKQVRFKQLGP
ncbi:zinc finger, CCHC-type containing LTR copia-type gag-polypeptide [Tanacetum coccineum]